MPENFVTGKSRQRAIAIVLASGLLLTGFVTGWIASRRVILAPIEANEPSQLLTQGDAAEAVRQDVLRVMREFQEGYVKRDVNEIAPYMQKLFSPAKDNLVLGTESGEWIRGHEQIAKFICDDWRYWGAVRIDLGSSSISSTGDVAWVASPGYVNFGRWQRPLRLTAILVRHDQRWMFRQIQFQWENNVAASLGDFFRPSTFSRLRWR